MPVSLGCRGPHRDYVRMTATNNHVCRIPLAIPVDFPSSRIRRISQIRFATSGRESSRNSDVARDQLIVELGPKHCALASENDGFEKENSEDLHHIRD
jgi:hypothetical protein